jgi:RHS repeat-associated protein
VGYGFSFNGMEKTDEINGEGNEYTTEFRQYDARLGRWLSLDPLFRNFPWQSPYAAFDNNPIIIKDPLGLAGEKSTGDDNKKHDKENKRYDNLKNKLAKKYKDDQGKYLSELARIGSRKRYGSASVGASGLRGESGGSPSSTTGSTFQDGYDNQKSLSYNRPTKMRKSGPYHVYGKEGEQVGESVDFDIKVNDGENLYLKSETRAGFKVSVFIDGKPLVDFAEATETLPADVQLPAQVGTHPLSTDYKVATVTTGSSSPTIVKITFVTTFTNIGAQVHYTSYGHPWTVSKVTLSKFLPAGLAPKN